MALTPSTMLELGTPAPHFNLPDPSGKMHSMVEFVDCKALLIVFMCNHCPYVKHIADGLAQFARDYADKGIGIIAINSNDVENYPDDSPDKMAEEARLRGYSFPYVFDETQEVALAYKAACTPDFFLFDQERRLVYRGQFDGSRPKSDTPVTGEDLRRAVDALLAGEPIPDEQIPSAGCNIKWKKGNEPSY